MRNRVAMIVLLGVLVVAAAVHRATQEPATHASTMNQLVWNGFLFGIPLILAGFLLAGPRWAFMAGVMYATIGLALDISTLVQELTHAEAQPAALGPSAVTGAVNFLLILIGGQGFLESGSAVGSKDGPPGARPPSPPSPSAT